MWSSLCPVSPDDRIELHLLPAGPEHVLHTHSGNQPGRQTLLRMRWLSNAPPDEHGTAITRQRLHKKFGADLRGVVTRYYWETESSQS